MTGTILANCAGYCEACNGDDRYPHRDSLAVRMQRPVPATTKEPAVSATTDAVNSPKHYQFFPDLEAISVIAMCMTQEQFYGYCLGNRLKYRLRAGNKDKLEQDIAKSDKYLELYEKHKGLCPDAK